MTCWKSMHAMLVIATGLLLIACDTAPRTDLDRRALEQDAEQAMQAFIHADPGMERLFETAYGIAVFPEVGKGGIGVGGAYGRGVVYQEGRMIGYADLTQGTIGLQLGGQSYRQVIFFQNRHALEQFTTGTFEFAAQASAVAATAGASADANYESGVMVFTLARGGLMAEASIGGQRFSFQPAQPARQQGNR
jgi:lipid-binding SYLF domain-containing protein